MFPGQMDLFNEAEAEADPSVPEPTLEEAVSGYKSQTKKAKATREEILAGLPVVEVPCTVPDEDRNCPYCNTPMEVIGKKVVREELRIIPAKVERIQYVQEVLGCPYVRKTALLLSLEPKHRVPCSSTALLLHPLSLM